MRYILARLAHWFSGALDNFLAYADPWPVCPECGQLLDPSGDRHAATCRRWGT